MVQREKKTRRFAAYICVTLSIAAALLSAVLCVSLPVTVPAAAEEPFSSPAGEPESPALPESAPAKSSDLAPDNTASEDGHPDDDVPETYEETSGIRPGDLMAGYLDGLIFVKPSYRLSDSAVIAPKPTKSAFGRSKKPADTARVLAEAELLLNGRELIWSPNRKTADDKWINWYRDDTIFVVTWRQRSAGMDLTFCEVVVAHPSQFRRYMADNSFSSRYRYTPTQMSNTVNAVVGISGDFCKYRKLGIVVYGGKLCRCETKKLDICFVDSSGNLKFVRQGELSGEEEVKQYIADNDIRFSLAFGPVMIEDGKNVVPTKKYPVGQILEDYTRCSISQLGEGHYLIAVASRGRNELPLKKLANELLAMGVDNAYALDGGQTASIVINGRLANPVDFGEERLMSDIIYFATAIPNDK